MSVSDSWTLTGKGLPQCCLETESLEECWTLHATESPPTGPLRSSRWAGQVGLTMKTVWRLPPLWSTTAPSTQYRRAYGSFQKVELPQNDQELWKDSLPFPHVTCFPYRKVIKSKPLEWFLEQIPGPTLQARQDRLKIANQTAGDEKWTQVKPNSTPAMKQDQRHLVIITIITTEIYTTLPFKNNSLLFYLLSRKSRKSN